MPYQIDKAVESLRRLHKLNRLEAQTMAQIIEVLKPDEAYVDAADTVEHRFGNHIKECLKIKTELFPNIRLTGFIRLFQQPQS